MTRFFLLIFAALLLCVTIRDASAQNQWTKEQLRNFYDQAQIMKRSCAANPGMYNAYDCDCIAAHAYDMRVKGDLDSSSPVLLQKIMPKCGNAGKLALQKYEQCREWASMRRSNYEAYCQCFGAKFADYFGKYPTSRGSQRIKMMTEAYKECEALYPDPSQRQNRQELKDELQQRGLFDRLFPGLSDN